MRVSVAANRSRRAASRNRNISAPEHLSEVMNLPSQR